MSIRATILDNLEVALNAIKDDISYEIAIAEVSRFDQNVLTTERHRFPLIMIVDTGPENLIIQDATHYRYQCDVALVGLVKSETVDDLQTDLNQLISVLKQFIDSNPDLGTNVMSIRFAGIDSNAYETKTEHIGSTLMGLKILYWCEAGTF